MACRNFRILYAPKRMPSCPYYGMCRDPLGAKSSLARFPIKHNFEAIGKVLPGYIILVPSHK